MKVRASVKKMCDKCKLVHRDGVVRVICSNPESINRGRVRATYGTFSRRRFAGRRNGPRSVSPISTASGARALKSLLPPRRRRS